MHVVASVARGRENSKRHVISLVRVGYRLNCQASADSTCFVYLLAT